MSLSNPATRAALEQVAETVAEHYPPLPMGAETAIAIRTVVNVLRIPRDRLGRIHPTSKQHDGAREEMRELAARLKIPNGGVDLADQAQMILTALVGSQPVSVLHIKG